MSTLSRTPYGYWGDCCLDFKTTLDLSIDSHNAGNLLFISDMSASSLSTVHSCHKFIVPKGLLMNSDLLVYSWFTQASFKPWDPKHVKTILRKPYLGLVVLHLMLWMPNSDPTIWYLSPNWDSDHDFPVFNCPTLIGLCTLRFWFLADLERNTVNLIKSTFWPYLIAICLFVFLSSWGLCNLLSNLIIL